MRYPTLRKLLPGWILRHILYFEYRIEQSVARFAQELLPASLVLDAGAGEATYKRYFIARHSYVGVDLAIGDPTWDYSAIDVIADLHQLPFLQGCFDACINIVTLEHLQNPAQALGEIARVLKPGGRLLLVAPLLWEVHQPPYDYFRFTHFGLQHLLLQAGFSRIHVEAVGGFFRVLSRRLWNTLQFFPGPAFLLVALAVAPFAFLLPLLEPLDRQKHFTLGYICHAVKA